MNDGTWDKADVRTPHAEQWLLSNFATRTALGQCLSPSGILDLAVYDRMGGQKADRPKL